MDTDDNGDIQKPGGVLGGYLNSANSVVVRSLGVVFSPLAKADLTEVRDRSSSKNSEDWLELVRLTLMEL